MAQMLQTAYPYAVFLKKMYFVQIGMSPIHNMSALV